MRRSVAPASTSSGPPGWGRLLLWGGAVGPPLFVLTFALEDLTRASFHPSRMPVSELAVGDFGWEQVGAFLVLGVLELGLAVGLYETLTPGPGSTWGPILIGAVGLGLVAAGVFTTDPVNGFPLGAPVPREPTLHSTLHDLASGVVFFALPAAAFVFARRFSASGEVGFSWYSVVTGVVFLAGFVAFAIGFNGSGGIADVAGWIQRATVVVGWTWLTLLAVHEIVSGGRRGR